MHSRLLLSRVVCRRRPSEPHRPTLHPAHTQLCFYLIINKIPPERSNDDTKLCCPPLSSITNLRFSLLRIHTKQAAAAAACGARSYGTFVAAAELRVAQRIVAAENAMAAKVRVCSASPKADPRAQTFFFLFLSSSPEHVTHPSSFSNSLPIFTNYTVGRYLNARRPTVVCFWPFFPPGGFQDADTNRRFLRPLIIPSFLLNARRRRC